MTFWNQKLEQGKETYDLAHLSPFKFEVTLDGFEQAVTISVTFNNHCYTEDKKYGDSQSPPLREPFVNSQEAKDQSRVFCHERYKLSFALPSLVRAFVDQKIAQTRHGDYVVLQASSGERYAVFFSMRRFNKSTCDLFVLSAYPLDLESKPAVTKRMRFKLAVAKIMRKKEVRFLK